jgi:hypothetical protein
MPDHDILLNCILEICCEPEPEGEALTASGGAPCRKAIRSLASELRAHAPQLSEADALAAAGVVLSGFDLAPRGSLQQFKAVIARVAKAASPKD